MSRRNGKSNGAWACLKGSRKPLSGSEHRFWRREGRRGVNAPPIRTPVCSLLVSFSSFYCAYVCHQIARDSLLSWEMPLQVKEQTLYGIASIL